MHSWLKIPTLYSFFRNLHIQLPKECAQNKKQWTACMNSLRFYETHEQSISHSDDYTRSVQLLWTAGAQGFWRRGVTGVVPVKECGAKENLWPDGRLFVQVCKGKGELGGVVCLAKRGGDGVDDVAEHLLEAGQVVRHRPQLPVQHRALHTVARSWHRTSL